jgi:hypothetical protein
MMGRKEQGLSGQKDGKNLVVINGGGLPVLEVNDERISVL